MNGGSAKQSSPKNALNERAEENIRLMQKAFEDLMAVARKNAAMMDWRASITQSNAKAMWATAIAHAEQNVTSSLEFARRLTRAADLRDVVELQTEFTRSQMSTLMEQSSRLGESLTDAIGVTLKQSEK